MSYVARDHAINELEGYTGRLVAPEAIHELDLRAIYETTVSEPEEKDKRIEELEDANYDLRNEVDELQRNMDRAMHVLRGLVEVGQTKKGRAATIAFKKLSHEAGRTLNGD